jgi:ABC-type glycerol-3-phosphate transport system permease component
MMEAHVILVLIVFICALPLLWAVLSLFPRPGRRCVTDMKAISVKRVKIACAVGNRCQEGMETDIP